ncbi:putative protein required for cell viability [Golovinomyces cichoracearum]|uniref:RNA polymerase II assembly factor RTP1 n=1 Tax=Golovinomyces cichoracearum TaxID=62708 RepID=A0A420HHD3_9PEZI|nr:putative protein required for cell viability [Golovinomyces cichoracearum]
MTPETQQSHHFLTDKLLLHGSKAFNPAHSIELRRPHLENYLSLIQNTSTLGLLTALNSLVQSTNVHDWLRKEFISTLSYLPLRAGGVQDTIEFILSVHPSNTNATLETTGKRSSVTHEALNSISKLLSSPPSSILIKDWFDGIAPQLLYLLQGDGEPEMDKVAAYVIGFGILGRRQLGAPGAPGWKSFIEPIYASLSPSTAQSKIMEGGSIIADDIIGLVGLRKVLSNSLEVANSIKRLSTLLLSHPHPALANRILRPILHPLWTLCCWPKGTELTEKLYRGPARQLLKILLKLEPKTDKSQSKGLLINILENFMCKKQVKEVQNNWRYAMNDDGKIQIETTLSADQSVDMISLPSIDLAIDSFIELLREDSELSSEIPTLFMRLISRWFVRFPEKNRATEVIYHENHVNLPEEDRVRLIEARVIQKMMVALPEKLIGNSKQLLELIFQVLRDSNELEGDESIDENVVSMALSLLNITITAPSFHVTTEIERLIEAIEKTLEFLSTKHLQETSRTAGNLLMLIRLRDTVNSPDADTSTKESLQVEQNSEDKKSYYLALSYLTGLDSPPPVRVQGLEILSNLVMVNSPILDVSALIELLSSLLTDNEEYVFLRVIKLLVQVSQKHPRTVMKDIMERYVDSSEELELDQRLRIGEALLQILQINSSHFKHETANYVCEGLLFIGGRRGYRSKTEKRQEDLETLKKKHKIEAEEAWGGPVPQLDEESVKNFLDAPEIVSQIVTGWESRRGMEDVRVRSSAVTILGAAIKSNIQNIKTSFLSAALDLSIHILTIEREIEKGILRRAAVVLIMNFLQALDSARIEGCALGFGLANDGLVDVQRILEYTESTDNDNMVRQHSRDVLESLESWSIKSLIPPERQLIGIDNLKGLPALLNSPNNSSNTCKIVEIE